MVWKRALGLGFLSWLAPFAISVVIFPLKKSYPPLFDVALSVVLTSVAVTLGCAYLRRPGVASLPVAAGLGALWMGMNIGLDLILFTWGPMAMSPAAYLTDIKLSYVVYPIIVGGLYVATQVGPRKLLEDERESCEHAASLAG